MQSQDKAIQTLTDLGITSCQAKVYLALVQLGASTVKTISKFSKVSRQDIYKITVTLQKLGLIEKILTNPISFRAIPIEKGFSILLERRNRKTCELQGVTDELIQNFATLAKQTCQQEGVEFSIITGKETLVHCALNAIEKAQKNIDYVTSSNSFFPWLIAQKQLYKRALQRGVKIRLIIDKPENIQSFPDIIQAPPKVSSIRVKYVPTIPKIRMGIYDRKDLYLNTKPMGMLKSYNVLWTNNPSVTEALQENFEIMWMTAMEKIPVKIVDETEG